MGPQHIIGLTAENVKRITVVKIECDKNNPAGVVIIKGENGAGKTSVLDAIAMTLRGGDSILEKPIRNGKEKACVILKTEDLIVKRRFVGENTYLEITNHDGLVYKTPQDLLNGLINTIGFDPIEFAEMDGKLQGARLLKICPADLDLAKNAADQKAAMEARRDVNRDVKRLEAQLAGMPAADPETPTEEVSIAALTQEIAKHRRAQDEAGQLLREIDSVKGAVTRCAEAIARLKEEIAKHEASKSASEARIKELEAVVTKTTDHTEAIAALEKNIENAETTNAKVRQVKQRALVAEDLKKNTAKSEEYDKKLKALIKAREDALQAAKFPVEGLSVDPDGQAIYKGNPLKQCATAEQISIGIALASAANPTMKVAFIRHGSLLDGKSMQLVAETAAKYGMQIWIERVEDNSPAAIHIVEGSNIGAKDVPDEKPDVGEKPADPSAPAEPVAKPAKAPRKKANDLFNA